MMFKQIAWATHKELYALDSRGVLRLRAYGRWEIIEAPVDWDQGGETLPIVAFAIHKTGTELEGHEESLAVIVEDGRLFERDVRNNGWREIRP